MQIKEYPITKNFHWITFLPNPTTPALEKYYQPYGSTEPARSPRGATAMIVIQYKYRLHWATFVMIRLCGAQVHVPIQIRWLAVINAVIDSLLVVVLAHVYEEIHGSRRLC